MRCSKAKKLISPYVDGELEPMDKECLESHIRQCSECGKLFEGLSEMHKAFAGTVRFKAPYGFADRVMARVTALETRKIFQIAGFARIAAFCLVVAVGITSGKMMMKKLVPGNKGGIMVSSLSLSSFDPAPPDSVGGAYLAMTEEDHED
ncbi:MAG: zf-HC2 domain-containing protein [Nitrospiraceae bacterium]|nr:zf-HC2 domain-containing protein [Nitrospiraceae bacterium]